MDILSIKGKLPFEIIESVLSRGITSFTPPQEAAIEKGLLSGKNLIVAAPTASGKTLIAEIACANTILGKGKKSVYIAPMRALVMEKFNEFRAAYPYIKTTVSIGDLDSGDRGFGNYDMLFVSTEKFDSLLRHDINWLDKVGCVIFDEMHMLGEPSRGPTLEILITKMLNNPNTQLIGLSATIGNAGDLSKWINAELIESDYRPVKLKRGVVYDGVAYCQDQDAGKVVDEDLYGASKIAEIRVLEDTLSKSKQLLIFYSTKRNAEAGAVKLSYSTKELLSATEKEKLDEVGNRVLNALERPTEQCVKLASLVKNGIAFHHAGLTNVQRNMIEDSFRKGLIKAICSTTTLGLGVNLPAHTVIIRDVTRFDGGVNERIGINEVLQLFGRAGRPKYDTEGRAFLIAAYKDRVNELYKRYLDAKPEPIVSNLGIIPVLRTHILSFIAEEFLNNKRSINGFLERSFYGYQYGDKKHIAHVVDAVVDELRGFEFVEEVDRGVYNATKLGKRVSELYIDPLSARWMLNCMEKDNDTIGMLYMISNTLEMRPYAKVTEEAESMYAAYRYIHGDEYIFNEMDRMDYGYYDPVRAFSTALLLKDWMDENKEQDIMKKYLTTPGEIYSKLSNADWLIYSAIELAKLSHVKTHEMINIRVRLRYGIKEELLDLVRLEQIGRVRARLLYINGIKSVADIRKNPEKVERLLGKDLGKRIMEQAIV
ncbi:MAG: DEAD/DEAH box helicase [Candidatus Marsarchaeota archaeon]|nr:DEAD/DEAH box helicase [Candidatus Marsarchaeota archaeon]